MPKPVEALLIRGATPFAHFASQATTMAQRAAAAVKGRRGMPGVPTGLSQLDEHLGGLQTGLHILGAEPGAGKTALALNIARNVAGKHRLPVVYVSYDELPWRLTAKLICADALLPATGIMSGRGDLSAFEGAIAERREKFKTLTFVTPGAKLTVADLSDQMTGLLDWHSSEEDDGSPDIGLLIVDYLQPMAAALADNRSEFRLAVGAITQELRAVANKTSYAVLLISAQNRAGQGTASMTSLRETSDLEYSADSIMLLTRDEDVMVGSGRYGSTLTIAKNRFGPSHIKVPLMLDGKTQVVIER